jgi:hypothetical protein
MNVLKHMEAVFLVALALAGTATWANGHAADLRATRATQVAVQGGAKLAVVKIEGKRLHAATRRAA